MRDDRMRRGVTGASLATTAVAIAVFSPAATATTPTSSPVRSAASGHVQAVESRTRTLTLAEARRQARAALRRRYGRRYTRGRARRMSCSRANRLRFRCRVSWRYRGTYRGHVSVWATAEDGERVVKSRVRVRYRRARSRQRPTPRRSCDPSYPTVCIRPPPPDLNCGDISHRDFAVRGSDPHGFDGDGDGVGCET